MTNRERRSFSRALFRAPGPTLLYVGWPFVSVTKAKAEPTVPITMNTQAITPKNKDITAPAGQQPHRGRSPTAYVQLGSRSPDRRGADDLRITRVSRCVARGFKSRTSFKFAACCWWPSSAVDGSSGASRGHAPEVRRPSFRWGAAVERPSVFQAGLIPSCYRSCECCAQSPVAATSRWSLLLLSSLLSAHSVGIVYGAAAATGAWRCARQLRSSASSMALRSYSLRPRESSQSTRSPVIPFSACTACRAHPRADSPSRSITVTRAYLPHGPSSAIVSRQWNRLASMILLRHLITLMQ